MTSEEKKKVQDAIAKGKLQEAITYLAQFLKETSFFSEIILISGKLERLNQNIRLGIIDPANQSLEFNNISYALVNLVETAEKSALTSDNSLNGIEPLFISEKNFISVKEGKFIMGSNTETPRERPAHQVKISAFAIYKYPITVNEYLFFCRETKKKMPPPPKWGWQNHHPMVNISWYDGQAFCKWAEVRLLTEAEWEYAAKGGENAREFPYSGSVILTEVGWYYDTARGSTQPVGQKKPNQLGLYDMTGNVWEWCQDAYCEYAHRKDFQNDPCYEGDKFSDRIGRGGSWFSYSKRQKITYRYKNFPTECRQDLGFRIAKV